MSNKTGVSKTGENVDFRPVSRNISKKNRQKLSYRKQIVRQLRTQYVEFIYNNPVTLKSSLRITQGHWKWNH